MAFIRTNSYGGKRSGTSFKRIANTYIDSIWSTPWGGIKCMNWHTGSIAFPSHDTNAIYTLICNPAISMDNGLTWMLGDLSYKYFDNFFS